MASRIEARDSADAFWTPPWGTRALCEVVLPHLGRTRYRLKQMSVWEPACGEGHMSRVLKEYFGDVVSSDIHDYGYGMGCWDFLTRDAARALMHDFIITNPPFGNLTIPFVLRALDLAKRGVAMFVRSQWYCEGLERYEAIFRDRPPTLFAPFVERVPLCAGRWDPDGTTATAYCWLVWIKEARGNLAPPRPTFHIPSGQRDALTHSDDRFRFARWMYDLAPDALNLWRRHARDKPIERIAAKFDLTESSAKHLVRFALRLESGEEAGMPLQEAAE